MPRIHLLALALLVGCPKAPAPEAPAEEPAPEFPVRETPGPLEPRAFTLPETETFTLSNGLEVVVARNQEVPLWGVRLVFDVGGFADPEGKEGLASVSFDMLDDGAGKLSAAELDRELKQLASTISAGADDDGAWVAAEGLTKNLEATLDLFALVVEAPTFPADEWKILQRKRIADVEAAKKDPSAIASRLFERVLYGDDYRGRLTSEATYRAITPADMKDFYRRHAGPENAILLVGGNVDPEAIRPLLEARLGDWKPKKIADPKPDVSFEVPERPVLYFHDFPGAAQSVLRVGTVAPQAASPDYFDLYLGNMSFGGAFTARINLNLREEKGYTYGARCSVSTARYGDGLWSCGTSVRTDATVPSLIEITRELKDVMGDRPITPEELEYFRSSEVLGYPGQFESTGAILREKAAIWQYGLPEDWTVRWLENVRGVEVEAANTALRKYLEPQRLTWLVVGDRQAVGPELEALGFEIVSVDVDGNVVEQASSTPAQGD